MVSVEEVKARIGRAVACEVLEVLDTSSGCGRSFDVTVVSADFEGVPLVQRHRRINTLFEVELASQIHALTLKTWTPAQYHKH